MPSINNVIDSLNLFFSQGIYNILLHPQFPPWMVAIKTVFIIFSFILVVMIFWLLTVSSWYTRAYKEDAQEFRNFKVFDAKRNSKQWQKIKKRLDTEKGLEYKLAVLEADDFLDRTLKLLNYDGKNVEEKLKKLDAQILPNLDSIKEARVVRNDIVHNRNFELTREKAEQVLSTYEKAIKSLRAI